MKQNRTIKSLLPRDNRDGKRFTVLLLILSVILCLGSASLMTVSVGAAADDEDWFIPYTGHDGNTEVLYKLEFSDLDNLGVEANEVYLDNNSVVVTPNVVKVENNTGDAEKYVNFLGGEKNEVYSDDITIIAGLNNIVSSGNDSASVLGGEENKVIGDSHGVPVVVAGGLTNKVEDGKGNVVLGGEENGIIGSSSSIVLGGERNVITGGENIIIGGENVKVSDVSNIFAFSDSDLDFQPEDSGAFYLNLTSGVGIYSDSVKKGVSLSGAAGFGNIDIETLQCNDDNIGVEGARNGCLVGCTEESKNNSNKWELLDRGSRCEELCNNNKCIFKAFSGLEEVPDYTGFCLTDHIDVSNATRCTTGENESYENVVFGSVLIDHEDECPTTGNNKCVYRCNPEAHLTGDVVGGTNAVMCYKDCELPWGETIKHNETRIAYNIEDVACSNDVYVFPLETEIINKPVSTYQIGNISKNGIVYKNRDKNGKSFESCGNYDHKKTLVCLSGSLYLLGSGGKADKTTKTVAEIYKYQSCNLHDYRCDTGVYSLTSQQIENEKNDRPANVSGNRVVADRGILTGVRGQYKLCVDYNANPTVNGESCVTDGVSPTAYHYQFLSCQDGYHTGAGYENVCMKDCNLKKSDGSNEAYRHMGVATGYQATGAVCTGTCLAEQIVCNDGTWKLGSLDGEENMQYLYNECDLKNKVCSTGDYNVEQSIVTNSGQHSIYESCDPYEASGMFECVKKDTVNKLVGCEEEYHTENNLYCEPNQKEVNCAYITGKYGGSGKYIDANVTVEWTGEWNNGIWTTPLECEWKCNEGYHLSGFVCVSNVMEVDCRKNGKPDNSYYVERKEFIVWSSNGWSRPDCDRECDDGYAEKDEHCYLSVTTLLSGQDFNMTIKRLAGNSSASYTTSGAEIQHIVHWSGGVLPEGILTGIISTVDSEFPVYAWFDDGTIYYYTEADRIYLNGDSRYMFSKLINLIDIDVTDFDASNVRYMNSFFGGCNSLEEIKGLDTWNTSNVTSMQSMFNGCSSLRELNINGWDVGNVTDMRGMFEGCSSLIGLDLSSWDTKNVTDMVWMFENCSNLTELNLSGWDNRRVTNMTAMFGGCSNLEILNLSNFKTSNVETMRFMFEECGKTGLILDLSSFNTSKVTDMNNMFANSKMEEIKGLDSSGWNTSNVKDMERMFQFSNFKSLDLNSWDTSSVTSMKEMFIACKNLMELNINEWNTESVKNMEKMFNGCRNLKELNLSGWNTSNVTNMSGMFMLSEVENLDLRSWNISRVKTMQSMFNGCSSLTGLDLRGWNPAEVTTMSQMFNGCRNLKELDLSGWNTSKLTNMGAMFYNDSLLERINMTNWNTNRVTNMGAMFSNCSSLKEIKGMETWDTSNVTNMGSMFNGCSGLESLDLSNFNTSEVVEMGSMFNGCSGLINLNLSGWNTSNVGYMGIMFQNCSSLENLDLSNFDTKNVKNMRYMFNKCSNLTTIYVSPLFVTSGLTSSDEFYHINMFGGDTKLVGGSGTVYDSSFIDKTYARIDQPSLGLPGYFTLKQ